MSELVLPFSEIKISDISIVGGKNASLGEMFNQLQTKGINIPDGFSTTSFAFWEFLKENNLQESLSKLLEKLDRDNYSNLSKIGATARQLILEGNFSKSFIDKIKASYHQLYLSEPGEVAVRSSATAEDLPNASFAGQHDSFLNIKGEENVVKAIKKCFSSLYTDRAIKYREEKGFAHEEVALSVGIQKMVRADKSCSGVGFTIDPETGFENVIVLSGVWGLGENMVQGTVNPDEFYVFKPTLKKNKHAILQKKKGDKKKTMVYATSSAHATVNIDTPKKLQEEFVLTDTEIIKLATWALLIEEHYHKPMDIEWAKDGITQELFIIQARPETVHQSKDQNKLVTYQLLEKGKKLAQGNAIGSKITVGKAVLLNSVKEAHKLKKGQIIVTDAITPDWDPVLKKSGGIITNKGGRTSHAAIVARELGVAAVVGCVNATQNIKNGELITLSCSEGKTGYVYKGQVPFKETSIDVSKIKMPKTEVKLILADPEKAFQYSFYPNNGVGLLRMEFIITHAVKVHPMALINFNKVTNSLEREQIIELTKGYKKKELYFIDKLSEGIATIVSAFYPKEVIVRFSDFKSNEYANLLGGTYFEPKEENPMLGFRGANRYYSNVYKEGFNLECQAIKKVRDTMGLTNVKVMVPFCRTLNEAKEVIKTMEKFGLKRGANGLEVYVMVEIPSNVILAQEFAKFFDGFSIGSNDLTQLTLGLDRDSELMSPLFNENNEASKRMIAMAIDKAKKANTKIGLCGQAPSDIPEFTAFLVDKKIDSISFNPDALLMGIKNINQAEKQLLNVKAH